MKGSEPLVEGNGRTSVVAFEVTVMKVVEVVAGFGNARVFRDLDFLESGMTPGGGEYSMQRMGKYDPAQQNAREIK